MPNKSVFEDQTEQLAIVVHALLQDKDRRSAFAQDPLAVLQQHGIEFKDPEVAKKVETELKQLSKWEPGDDICPPLRPIGMRVCNINTLPPVLRTVRLVVRASHITWYVKPKNIDDMLEIDKMQVDVFQTQVGMERLIDIQNAQIAEQNELILKQATEIKELKAKRNLEEHDPK